MREVCRFFVSGEKVELSCGRLEQSCGRLKWSCGISMCGGDVLGLGRLVLGVRAVVWAGGGFVRHVGGC